MQVVMIKTHLRNVKCWKEVLLYKYMPARMQSFTSLPSNTSYNRYLYLLKSDPRKVMGC